MSKRGIEAMAAVAVLAGGAAACDIHAAKDKKEAEYAAELQEQLKGLRKKIADLRQADGKPVEEAADLEGLWQYWSKNESPRSILGGKSLAEAVGMNEREFKMAMLKQRLVQPRVFGKGYFDFYDFRRLKELGAKESLDQLVPADQLSERLSSLEHSCKQAAEKLRDSYKMSRRTKNEAVGEDLRRDNAEFQSVYRDYESVIEAMQHPPKALAFVDFGINEQMFQDLISNSSGGGEYIERYQNAMELRRIKISLSKSLGSTFDEAAESLDALDRSLDALEDIFPKEVKQLRFRLAVREVRATKAELRNDKIDSASRLELVKRLKGIRREYPSITEITDLELVDLANDR